MLLQQWTQLRNRPFQKVPPNILEGLEADATAERMFLKRPPNFFGYTASTVEATAQQAFLKGPSKYSGRVERSCNSGTGVIEKPPHFFGSVAIQTWMQLRNRGFPKDPMKI